MGYSLYRHVFLMLQLVCESENIATSAVDRASRIQVVHTCSELQSVDVVLGRQQVSACMVHD